MMNCIECPWFESCDELDESYCINDELNRVKTELEEMEENKMEKELVWTNEDAIKILANARYADDLQGNEDLTTAHYMAIEALKSRPTSRWSRQTDTYHDYYECENCGIGVGLDDVRNFCPNCGAKMEGDIDADIFNN